MYFVYVKTMVHSNMSEFSPNVSRASGHVPNMCRFEAPYNQKWLIENVSAVGNFLSLGKALVLFKSWNMCTRHVFKKSPPSSVSQVHRHSPHVPTDHEDVKGLWCNSFGGSSFSSEEEMQRQGVSSHSHTPPVIGWGTWCHTQGSIKNHFPTEADSRAELAAWSLTQRVAQEQHLETSQHVQRTGFTAHHLPGKVSSEGTFCISKERNTFIRTAQWILELWIYGSFS